jgi:hypothetical protein
MLVLLSLLSLTGFANTFEWKGSHAFSLSIDAKNLIYNSTKKKVEEKIRPCNLPLVRALNAELAGLVPQTEVAGGITYMMDANSFQISKSGKEAELLNEMDKKIDFFREEEMKSCRN